MITRHGQGVAAVDTASRDTLLQSLERQADELNHRACQAIEQGELAQGYALFQQSLSLLSSARLSSEELSPEQLPLALREIRARLSSNLGVVAARMRRFSQSRQAFLKALVLFEELGNAQQVALQHGNLGSVCRDTGEYRRAIEHYHRAVGLLIDASGDETLLADQWSNLAFAHSQIEQYQEAIDYFDRAVDVYQRCGNARKVQLALENIERLQSRSTP